MASLMDARRRILMCSPHIESVSGNLASFKTDIKAPLKSVKVYFSPIQSGTGDPSPTNVRPISGHDGVTLTHTGVNLLRCDTFANGSSRGVTFTGTRNSDGEIESISVVGTANAQNLFRNLNYVNGEYKWPPYGNTIATFTYCDDIDVILAGPDKGLPDDIYGVDGARSYLGRIWRVFDLTQNWPSSNGEWFRLQGVPYQSNGVTYNSIARPMVCVYDDMGCEFEPYKGKDITVSWQTEAGTVYGGYIDLVSGILTVTYIAFTFDGTEPWEGIATSTPTTTTCFHIWLDKITGENIYGSGNLAYCSHFKFGGNGTTTWGEYRYNPNSNGRAYISFVDPYLTHFPNGLSEFKEWVSTQNNAGTPLQFVVPLTEPKTYQLSPQTIKTIKGRNNIWSSAKENIEVEYWTH